MYRINAARTHTQAFVRLLGWTAAARAAALTCAHRRVALAYVPVFVWPIFLRVCFDPN